jgi:hypothetical protein
VLIPALPDSFRILLDQSPDAAEIPQIEPVVAGEQEGRKPEFALHLFSLSMDVHRLGAVEAVEEQAERTGHPLDRRHPEGYTTTQDPAIGGPKAASRAENAFG